MGVRVNHLHYGNKPQRSPNPELQPFDIDFTILSYDVGHEKPDPRIFFAAEEMLASLLAADGQKVDVDEWRKVYVGDEFAKDVVGATRAGWGAVLVDREEGGQKEDVVWLHEDQPGELFGVLARVGAVGFRSLGELGEWLPKKG
jgi:phosphoglycolate phosphatase-like HAD superfamily hydrolase